jgi:iron(III) transport system substrate-binding protein
MHLNAPSPSVGRSATHWIARVAMLAVLLAASAMAQAQQVLNLYSARHYSTDEALYADFTRATGIRINRLDADDAGILARLRTEGAASPADVILLVDAARLVRGEADGLFRPVQSTLLQAAIPAEFRSAPSAEGTAWFGFSSRARVLAYDKTKLKPADVDTYEKLAAPALKGQICIRSGSHPYNLSLVGAMLARSGEAATEQWLRGLVGNLARDPKGGDTDQIRAVAAGECAVAVTNSYYLARLMRSNRAEDKAVMDKIGVMFPNQTTSGTHMNISGGAVARHAKNVDAAVKFLEYLASPSAQTYFADGNNEWPTVRNVRPNNPALATMAPPDFKTEQVGAAAMGANIGRVQMMMDRAGYK